MEKSWTAPRGSSWPRQLQRVRWIALLAAIGLGPAGSAQGAGPVTRPAETADAMLVSESQSWNRYLKSALGLPSWLDLAVDQRTRFELLSGPFRPEEPDTQSQLALRTRLRVGIDGPGPLRFLAELQDARVFGDKPLDFLLTQIDTLDVLQLFVSAETADLLGSGLRADIHVGRLTMDFGSRRLVARNRFRNATNSFDGIHLQIGDGQAWRVRAFLTRPVLLEEGYFDNDSSAKQRFWGVALEDKRIRWLNLDAYYFGLRGQRIDREFHTFGLRGYRPAQLQQLDYEIELIGQFGELLGEDHSAFAGHAELGYTLDLPWSPRLVGQFDYASGTADPGGGESHTFVFLFGARRFDLVPTGIFGPFRRSNILSPGVRLVVSPHPKVEAELKVRYWELAQARDRFVGTFLQDPTGASGRNLGTDIELRVRWKPTPWLAVEAGYDHWFKGSYLDRVPNASSTRDSDYVYMATRFRF
jgi:hypothetical protein